MPWHRLGQARPASISHENQAIENLVSCTPLTGLRPNGLAYRCGHYTLYALELGTNFSSLKLYVLTIHDVVLHPRIFSCKS